MVNEGGETPVETTRRTGSIDFNNLSYETTKKQSCQSPLLSNGGFRFIPTPKKHSCPSPLLSNGEIFAFFHSLLEPRFQLLPVSSLPPSSMIPFFFFSLPIIICLCQSVSHSFLHSSLVIPLLLLLRAGCFVPMVVSARSVRLIQH